MGINKRLNKLEQIADIKLKQFNSKSNDYEKGLLAGLLLAIHILEGNNHDTITK